MQEDTPIIEINIRGTHSRSGKTAIAAILLKALENQGLAGELRCQDGDFGKFFRKDEKGRVVQPLAFDDLTLYEAVESMKLKDVSVVINDVDDPTISRRGYFQNSKAMTQGGLRRGEMVTVVGAGKAPPAGIFRLTAKKVL